MKKLVTKLLLCLAIRLDLKKVNLYSMNVALIGATGLTGSELLKVLSADDAVASVRLLVRRPFASEHPKIEVHVVDLADPEAYRTALQGYDAVFVAIGTTMRKVHGNKNAYRRIDHDIPAHAAAAAAAQGLQAFGMVSSVGANANLRFNFYLRLKGETEASVCRHAIPKILLARPSFLVGLRTEYRPAERWAQLLMVPLLDWLLPKRMSRYHSITAQAVARALVAGVKALPTGHHILEYDQLKALSEPA